MKPLRTAFSLIFCALLVTAAAPFSARVLGISSQGVTLEGQGERPLMGIFMPDEALRESWAGAHLPLETRFRAGAADRYGRAPLQGELQERLLRDGVAIAYGRAAIPESWQRAEAEARAARRGIWKDIIVSAEDARAHRGQLRLVTGVVQKTYAGREATYLNFGEQWWKDFSILIPARARKLFPDLELVGKTVTARGVIYEEEGPALLVTRPEQLEIHDAD